MKSKMTASSSESAKGIVMKQEQCVFTERVHQRSKCSKIRLEAASSPVAPLSFFCIRPCVYNYVTVPSSAQKHASIQHNYTMFE